MQWCHSPGFSDSLTVMCMPGLAMDPWALRCVLEEASPVQADTKEERKGPLRALSFPVCVRVLACDTLCASLWQDVADFRRHQDMAFSPDVDVGCSVLGICTSGCWWSEL